MLLLVSPVNNISTNWQIFIKVTEWTSWYQGWLHLCTFNFLLSFINIKMAVVRTSEVGATVAPFSLGSENYMW